MHVYYGDWYKAPSIDRLMDYIVNRQRVRGVLRVDVRHQVRGGAAQEICIQCRIIHRSLDMVRQAWAYL